MLRFLLLLIPVCQMVAHGPASQGAQKMQESVGQMKQVVDGQQLQYLLQVPNGQPPKNGWPLLMFLHGYGECGDNIQLMKVHGPPKLADRFDLLSSCVIVSPQCPKNSWWRVRTLQALLHEMQDGQNPIDRSRCYLTGLSMGGYGTWSYLSNFPNDFAAAVPICGGGNPLLISSNVVPDKSGVRNEFKTEGLQHAAHIPIRTFHGARDAAIPITESEHIVWLLQHAGSKSVELTTYEQSGHIGAWQRAYRSQELWDWLFQQRLGTAE